jgi:HEAT repeat protein
MDEDAQKEFDLDSLLDKAQQDIDLGILLAKLESSERATRMEAIDELSRVGDEEALEALRDRLRFVSREHQALIISIGTLRWRLSGTAHSSLDQH